MTEEAVVLAAQWSYGIAAAAFLALAIRLLLGWHKSRSAALLLAVTLASAAWAAGGIAVVMWPRGQVWLASVVLDAFRYTVWFAFVASVLRGTREGGAASGPAPRLPRWFVPITAVGLVLSVVLAETPPFGLAPDDLPRTWPYGARLGLAILGLILVEQLLYRADPRARWAVRPLCVGLAGMFAFDLYFYADAMLFGYLDVDIWIARGVANALVVPLLALAATRSPRWSVEMNLSRGAVFHSTALLASGLFLLVVAGTGFIVRLLGGEWGNALQIVLLFFALLVVAFVVSSGRFRARLRVFVSKHFFSYRYDYREEWLRFTRALATESSLVGVQERSITALADLVESPGGALWMKEGHAFVQASRSNMPASSAVESVEGSLAQFLARTGWVIDLNEFATHRERYSGLVLPEWLAALPAAWLVVPLVLGAELIGFVVLANPRTPIEVDWEVRDLLQTASRQAASYVGHVRATESLLEARKFDAFNRMSAFVVHDLKNLVAQLSLMLRNAERHRDNPEFQRDMLATVEHVVGRMYKLMLQLRSDASPIEQPRVTDLEAVVRKACAAKADRGARIALDLAPGIAAIGHADRLEHVIGHLVQNALDATTGGGSVSVSLALEPPFAVLEVADTGVGMTPEFVRDRLFRPFQTSKADGLGIGVYESAQYVRALGGQLLVESTPGAGTRVRVLLPSGEGARPPVPASEAAA